MSTRFAPLLVAAAVLPGLPHVVHAEAVAVPGACYGLSVPKSTASRLVDRIELQVVQATASNGTPAEPARVRIAIQPKGQDDLIPSALSEPCSGTAPKLACRIACATTAGATSLGSFRIAPEGRDGMRLTIEAPLTLNACATGETPVALPKALAGKSFTLRRAGASDCFH